ncbi:glycosyltransferase family 2 protein [Alteromonas sp. M12]|uniref:glycosyltransferase family 2 protein n=1 Tax=Alteromonas sp. M12 TaxID=3135644 RepID=UPI00319E7BED
MKNSVSVIIPFYQRSMGLLKKALLSVAQQSAFSQIDKVIVVDDGSPIGAREEIEQLNNNQPLLEKIQLIEKPNGGVASARNAGIDAVSAEVKYVALLDPDDVWLPDHLELALEALRSGSDFHFNNFTHIGQTVGAFERAGYITPSEHPPLDNEYNHTYKGDIVRQITTANVIGASSVIYDIKKHKDCRFKTDFQFAGEDYLMWLDITRNTDGISFTNKITTHCGEGINLFSGAAWCSAHLSKRLFDEINYRYFLLQNIAMTESNRRRVAEMLFDNRNAYIGNLQSMLKRLKLSGIVLLLKHFTYNKPFRDTFLKRIK